MHAKRITTFFTVALTVSLGDVRGDININFNNDQSCTIRNGRLFINGVDKGPLTPSAQIQYAAYKEEVRKWSAALQKSIQDSFPWNGPDRNKFPWNPTGEGAPGYGNPNWPFPPPNRNSIASWWRRYRRNIGVQNAILTGLSVAQDEMNRKRNHPRLRRQADLKFPDPPPFCYA
ncbi:hypothetical protein AB6A40_001198 [Gnathostoma spinigerum]|uniref:Pepsin inhibitor-3-like repeated domain-containing protein n=1 Tax=Gnathostoma spinigerum TaxID=75299 RepID=A0ABD6E3L9_9BILA